MPWLSATDVINMETIYMFNPIVMSRLSDLLQQGVVMKRKFQPYEAHLQYLLQFMTDYNLYGCDYLDTRKTRFRAPVPDRDDGVHSSHIWHSQSVDPDQVTDDPALPRVSHCSIEVDICVQDILNRQLIQERPIHHDFTERANPLHSDVKLVSSMAGLWKDETKRRQVRAGIAKKGSTPFPPEVLVTMSADPRQSQPTGWVHEDEYRDLIKSLIGKEKESLGGQVSFDNFAHTLSNGAEIRTAFQSVEDLYPANLLPLLGLPAKDANDQLDPTGSIEVDERKVVRARTGDEDFFPEDSDEEALRDLVPHGSGHGDVEEDLVAAAASASASSGNKALGENIKGVCASAFKTGRIPKIPVCQELLDIAEDEGLVGRIRATGDGVSSMTPAQKRKGSFTMTASASKRIRPTPVTPTPGFATVPRPSQSTGLNKQSFNERSMGGSDLEHSSRTPQKPRQSGMATTGRLDFAVVKDPLENLPKSQSSHASLTTPSKSDDATPRKTVTFDPPSSFADLGSASSYGLPSSFQQLDGKQAQGHLEKLQRTLASAANGSQLFVFAQSPPEHTSANLTALDHRLPDVVYKEAHYSKEADVPSRAREYAGREFKLEGSTLPFLPDFDPSGLTIGVHSGKRDEPTDQASTKLAYERQRKKCTLRNWEFAEPPPTYDEVAQWWDEKGATAAARQKQKHNKVLSTQRRYLSQIEGPTPRTKHGLLYTQKKKSTSVQHEVQYMSTMSMEIHVNTRGKFVPNPEEDEVQCIFWSIKSDEVAANSQDAADGTESGMIVFCEGGDLIRRIQQQCNGEVVHEKSELDLMVRMVEIVRTHDPDVLTGYEVHGSSWGFLIERARLKYDYNLCDEFSRVKTESHGRFGKDADRWGFTTTSTIRVTGRHMINIWRAMRGELNLLQYTMENVVWHTLHRRIPHYSWKTLSSWYVSGKPRDLAKLLGYYQTRTKLDMQILEANELIPRTSEQARLLGVDFFSVFSRGSQYKVESIMFRIAKPENFLLVSPSRKQVGGQNALECLPLVMEPQSAFYSSPLLVLDFQSLYPSVMIAYNLCYSTFLGRITNWRGMSKMGFAEYKRQQGLLALLEDYINITPNGMMYVKTEIRKSLLAKMLTEILETRVMVKSGMKQDKDDKTLQKLLNNRQLALKLLANVTYGYTSASFSGRMPCSEIADSIVQTGRETLERAIAYIHSVEKWGAEVVYGDTDSLFVYLKGKTRDEAFDIGREMAMQITDMNPRPVKLKFEKVYHPCVLLAKKRYVGYKYESKDQVRPEFDAKGIETVRRDGTPAEQKIEEKALQLLFETADLSQIKEYFQKQCEKIMRGTVSVQDFCFAKEVRLGTYSDKGLPPAGALISTKRMLEDARAEPQYGERVPYVVITGAPGARLIDRCVAPEELLRNPHWQLDAEYYISKNLIPPLERIFNLVGANVRGWYDAMPKIQRIHQHGGGLRKATLESYMKSTHCVVCFCRGCSGLGALEDVACDSKDCPVFWTRMRQLGKVKQERAVAEPVMKGLMEGVDRLALDCRRPGLLEFESVASLIEYLGRFLPLSSYGRDKFFSLLESNSSEAPNELVRLCDPLVGKAKDDSPEEAIGHLLHGNPYRDRKVVLSEPLIKSGEITMPEVVQPAAIPELWLQEVQIASKEASSRNAPLVLLIFCHGAPGTTLELNYHCPDLKVGKSSADRASYVVTAKQLLKTLDPDCRTTILSTACFSGSWLVDMLREVGGFDPNGQEVVNTTMLSAADYKSESLAWPESTSLGRSCGSIFASSVINHLTSSDNLYLADTEKSDTHERLQPAKPSEEQIETYNSYCRSITDSVSAINRHGIFHNFTFSTRNDQWKLSWPDLVGLEPLQNTFQKRWQALETVTYKGPECVLDPDPRAPELPADFDTEEFLSSHSQTGSGSHKALLNKFNRLAAAGKTVELAKLLVQYTRVDKRAKARTDREVYNLICQTAGVEEREGFPKFKVDVLHAIKLRWFLAYVADCMVRAYRLPVPCGVRCLMRDMQLWVPMISAKVCDWEVRMTRINRLFEDKGDLHPPVEDLQGRRFQRFPDYLVFALVEAKLSVAREKFIVDSLFKFMKVFENTTVPTGVKMSTKDPNLRQPLPLALKLLRPLSRIRRWRIHLLIK
ncbi:DNA polymerase zeta catalytic subunit-like protein [Emericellopsis cladophorae]|uniref:DNA polymerase zeta catalytic subunit n=1 Tax=Emericellopsis cladophorae TaxID=2686198 RepID=A0A9P9Y092_9HYPO|nr:DNA polymerase zeta catalytic subunit-like protein [Emericellopsis cladophorae]KAI6780584.1 DNA polymerase zeta catalytic subunit-like protein [Emericellopsis cladophorae]